MGPAGVGEVMDVPVNFHARKLCVPVLRSTSGRVQRHRKAPHAPDNALIYAA